MFPKETMGSHEIHSKKVYLIKFMYQLCEVTKKLNYGMSNKLFSKMIKAKITGNAPIVPKI